MTEEKLAAYLKERGFRVETRNGKIAVILEKSDLIRFGFPIGEFGENGEGFAAAVDAFADELNGNLIYSVIVHALTGLSPSEVGNLPDENFEDMVRRGALTEARSLATEAMEEAKRLSKTAGELAEEIRSGAVS